MPRKAHTPASRRKQAPGETRRHLSDPETLANFARNLQEGIYITNETGEVLDANPAFLENATLEHTERVVHRLQTAAADAAPVSFTMG